METQNLVIINVIINFFLVENITILSVSSDDFLHAFFLSCRTANVELQFVFKK